MQLNFILLWFWFFLICYMIDTLGIDSQMICAQSKEQAFIQTTGNGHSNVDRSEMIGWLHEYAIPFGGKTAHITLCHALHVENLSKKHVKTGQCKMKRKKNAFTQSTRNVFATNFP